MTMTDAEAIRFVEEAQRVRDAIAERIKATRIVSGAMDCPVCGGTRTLRYHESSHNGHIHARCKTDGCVSFME